MRNVPLDALDVSPDTSAGLYALFLEGRSLEQIQARNKHLTLGQITDAAVVGDWPAKKREYLDALYTEVADRAKKAIAEGVDFSALYMGAFHKANMEPLLRFMQTGDREALKDMTVSLGSGTYKQMIEQMLKLTEHGQPQRLDVSVSGEVNHTVAPPVESGPGWLARSAAAKKAAAKADQ